MYYFLVHKLVGCVHALSAGTNFTDEHSTNLSKGCQGYFGTKPMFVSEQKLILSEEPFDTVLDACTFC